LTWIALHKKDHIFVVIPAKAGIQTWPQATLDARLRGHDNLPLERCAQTE